MAKMALALELGGHGLLESREDLLIAGGEGGIH